MDLCSLLKRRAAKIGVMCCFHHAREKDENNQLKINVC